MDKIKDLKLRKRYWTYFRRGHTIYLVFFISFMNFVVIQYSFLIEKVPFLKMLFMDLIVFTAVFILVYIPLATVIGWYDYKRGAVPTDAELIARASPWNRDLAKALISLSEAVALVDQSDEVRKHKNEVKELLEKWTKKL